MFCISDREINLANSQQKLHVHQKNCRDAGITAIVLCMISIFFFAGACFLYGMGTLNPQALHGLGVIPYLGGVCLHFLSLGVLIGSGIFGILAAVHAFRKDQLSY